MSREITLADHLINRVHNVRHVLNKTNFFLLFIEWGIRAYEPINLFVKHSSLIFENITIKLLIQQKQSLNVRLCLFEC